MTSVPQPTVTAGPTHQAVVADTTARFTVQAEGQDVTYQWQFCAPEYEKWVTEDQDWQDISPATEGCSGVNTAQLTVKATTARNGFFYRCAVTNSGGTVYSGSANLYACNRRLGSGLYWTLTGPDDYSGQKTAAFAGSGAIPDYASPDDEGNGSPWSDDVYLGRVILGPDVTGVGSCAFTSCTHLSQVLLPDSLVSIGESAFSHCFYAAGGSAARTVTIPAGVTTIGAGAFAECGSSLTAIRVEADNRAYCSVDGVLYDRAKTGAVWSSPTR